MSIFSLQQESMDMERVWKPLQVAVTVMLLLAGQTAAQAQVADTTATAIQLDARIDSLAVQLRQAQEAIARRRRNPPLLCLRECRQSGSLLPLSRHPAC